ncbi:DUF6521 family protein [Trichocoleus desertorum AS-A10]|uniref:three component ABC system middle component n=1 Tax=Trichocoleus desertorum TaxID=1481672 RepID=UPI0032995768
MTVWDQRPVESANLFNPAFCGEIIRLCVKSYFKESGRTFPYALAFLVLPIVLYHDTRVTMSARQYSYLHVWVQDNMHLRVNFANRARELVPVTREAITFLLQIGALELSNDAALHANSYRRKKIGSQNEASIASCYDKSELLGKWFARAGDTATIYVMWGVKP